MIEILKKMSFDGVMYKKLLAPNLISRLEEVALHLMPLEQEIMQATDGRIDIHSTGTWMTAFFNDEVTIKINLLLEQK